MTPPALRENIHRLLQDHLQSLMNGPIMLHPLRFIYKGLVYGIIRDTFFLFFSCSSCDVVKNKQAGGGKKTQLSLEFITSHPSLYCKKMFKALQLHASKMTQGKYLKHPRFPLLKSNQCTNSFHSEKNTGKLQPASGIYHLPSRVDASYKSALFTSLQAATALTF